MKVAPKKEPGEDVEVDDELVLFRHQGKQAEQDGDLAKAVKAYEQDIRKNPLHEDSYRRLLIIYRKLKQPQNEWRVLMKGISTWEAFYKPKGSAAPSKKISSLSAALLKTTGLSDRKGKPVYLPEPLAGWEKRKKALGKKLGK